MAVLDAHNNNGDVVVVSGREDLGGGRFRIKAGETYAEATNYAADDGYAGRIQKDYRFLFWWQ